MKKDIYKYFITIFVSFFISVGAGFAETSLENQTLVFGGDAKYPPYEFLNENNVPTGFSVEISRALAEVMGVKIEIKLGSWDKMRSAMNSGDIALLQGMSYSREREKDIDFSQPYTLIQHSVFIRKNTLPVYSFEALAGKKVLVQKNGIMHDTIKTSYPRIISVPVESQADALRQLSAGAYDYAIVAHLPGAYFIKNYRLTNIKQVGNPVAVQRYCYASLKGENSDLIVRISEGLAILKRTGQLDRIYEKWLGVLEPETSFKKIIRIGSVAGVILVALVLVTLLWSALLKRQVALRTEELDKEVKARKLAAKELETRQKQLIQADKMTSLGYLVAGIAHELNNPNGLIMMNIPVLTDVFQDALPILEQQYQKEGDFTAGGISYSRMRHEIPLLLSETKEATTQIKSIVEGLKDFARQSDDDYSEPADINRLVTNSLRLVKKTVEESTMHFSISYGKDIPNINVNPQRIEQVIINLLLNACQALDDPTDALFLSTSYEPAHKKVKVVVNDQGSGIAASDLPHLTDPFFTTKRAKGGTGLGLSISAGIVKTNNGTLDFDSSLGTGTTVTVSFPVQDG